VATLGDCKAFAPGFLSHAGWQVVKIAMFCLLPGHIHLLANFRSRMAGLLSVSTPVIAFRKHDQPLLGRLDHAFTGPVFDAVPIFDNGWTASLAAYASSADGLGQAYYGRQDVTLSKTLGLGKDSQVTGAFTARHFSNRSSKYLQDYGKPIESRYDNAMQYLMTVRLDF
jgi:hypothetical protein